MLILLWHIYQYQIYKISPINFIQFSGTTTYINIACCCDHVICVHWSLWLLRAEEGQFESATSCRGTLVDDNTQHAGLQWKHLSSQSVSLHSSSHFHSPPSLRSALQVSRMSTSWSSSGSVSSWRFSRGTASELWASTSSLQPLASSGRCWCKAGFTRWTTPMGRSKLELKGKSLIDWWWWWLLLLFK